MFAYGVRKQAKVLQRQYSTLDSLCYVCFEVFAQGLVPGKASRVSEARGFSKKTKTRGAGPSCTCAIVLPFPKMWPPSTQASEGPPAALRERDDKANHHLVWVHVKIEDTICVAMSSLWMSV